MEIIVIGGGAAGFFGAIQAAEIARDHGVKARITVLEKGAQFLSKVRISGGGRCNVTHSCFDPRALATRYPRGERALIGPFRRFGPTETIAWYAARGVRLKTEEDGRMFPESDDSQTIIDCLMGAAREHGITLRPRCGVRQLTREETGFHLALDSGETLRADRVLIASGGSRSGSGSDLALSLGHSLEAPVPSLFTFHIATPWLRELAGVAVNPVEATVPGTRLKERGPLLMTHWGVSGPVILRLSAWGARELHERNYRFPLRINWVPDQTAETLLSFFQEQRDQHPGALVARTPLRPLPARIWEKLVEAAGIAPATRWAILSRTDRTALGELLRQSPFEVEGKSTHKAEFVTCGGIPLREVTFKTMESRVIPGLFFAGEVLDIDGITGGFNFQAAWTTGWIAARGMIGVDA